MTASVLFDCPDNSKRCTKCRENQPLTEFYIDKRYSSHVSRCRSCIYKQTSKYQRSNPKKAWEFAARYRAKHPEKHRQAVRNYRLKNAEKLKNKSRRSGRKTKLVGLGMTLLDLNAAFELQNGKCAICEGEITLEHGERGQSAHIDHCHKANKFRGILCSYCNVGLGCFYDDPAKLSSAISYLKKHK